MTMTGVPRDLEGRVEFVKVPARDQVADSGEIVDLVAGILADVRARGDAAVR